MNQVSFEALLKHTFNMMLGTVFIIEICELVCDFLCGKTRKLIGMSYGQRKEVQPIYKPGGNQVPTVD